MVYMKIKVWILLFSSATLVYSQFGDSHSCYHHTSHPEIMLVLDHKVPDIEPPMTITLETDGDDYNFEFQKGVKCTQTFRIAYLSTHKGPYTVKILLKLYPPYKQMDEFELTFENSKSTLMELIGGSDPNISMFIEVLGSESKILTSKQSRDEIDDHGYPAFLRRLSVKNQLYYCAVIFYESKHIIMPIKTKGGTEAFSRHFSFIAVVSKQSCASCPKSEITRFESSGYVAPCPPKYRLSKAPLTYFVLEKECKECSVKLSFASADNLGDINVVFHQGSDTNTPGGTSDPSNKLDLPTIRLQPFSDNIASELPGEHYLNLLEIESKKITSTCDYSDKLKLTKREGFYKKTHVVSRVYSARGVETVSSHVVASRPVKPSHLEGCSSKWKSS